MEALLINLIRSDHIPLCKGDPYQKKMMLYACLKSNYYVVDFVARSSVNFRYNCLSHVLSRCVFILFQMNYYAIVAGIFLLFIMTKVAWAVEPVEVLVEGIEGAALNNAQEVLTLPTGLVRDGKVDRLWLDRFAGNADKKVLTALEPFGYYNARVTVTLNTVGEGEYRLRIGVDPGKPVRVAVVNVGLAGPGAHEPLLKKLIAGFPLSKGDVLLQPKYEEAKGAVKALAQKLGYRDADFSVHEIRINRDKTLASIDLLLDSGKQYHFDGTTIEGAPDYPDGFLRRYLTYKSGDVFSYDKLGETQLNFTNSERFKEVVVTPEKKEVQGDEVPVQVQLKQGPRRSIRTGVGYGTDTGARFSLHYRDLNLFHLGHQLDVNLEIAQTLQGLSATYTLPKAGDIRSTTSFRLNFQHEDVITYSSRLESLEMDRNYGFGKGKLLTAYLRLQQEDFTVGTENSNSRLVLPGLRYTEDHYDNLIRPSHGYRFALEARGTHQFLGSNTDLLQFIAEGGYIMPLPWRLSLQVRGKSGYTPFSGPLTNLPPDLRFFAGGDQSVRSYTYQSLGPQDANGLVVGGKDLLFGSVEMEWAFFKNWGISLFYDAGNAFDSYLNIHLAQGAGPGLHYYTPVGSLNLYVARQLGVSNPHIHIDFTVGFEL
jgi:translocation and assembly module TamA